MKATVKTLDNKEAGSVELNQDIFGVEPREDILQRVVRWQLAKRQAGTHQTKTQGAISGTGRKPWKQKGTGRARAGSLRSPHHRGGATVFGPVVRSHAFALPKKIRALGLKMALAAKLASQKLMVLDSEEIKSAKTKDVSAKVKALHNGSALFIAGDKVNENFAQAIANLPGIDALPAQGANVYDILKHDAVVITKDGLKQLEERLS